MTLIDWISTLLHTATPEPTSGRHDPPSLHPGLRRRRPWYHCVTRCVRRAFLCGEDSLTGRSRERRRAWLADRIKELAGIFAIDVAGYAAMSNHAPLVVRIDRDRALGWSVDEVLMRWLSEQRSTMSAAEIDTAYETAEVYRAWLYDLSWLMRTLNEDIARRANAEDGVKGRFWEGRFKSQALLDEPPEPTGRGGKWVGA
jgi:hypothetical protein